MSKMKMTFVSSPLRGDFTGNVERAINHCKWVLKSRNSIPIAPHVYFTRFLDDDNTKEQETGLNAGLQLMDICDEVCVFIPDTGKPSFGMSLEIEYAKKIGKKLTFFN